MLGIGGQAAAAQESYALQYGALPHEHDIDDLTGRQAADWNHAIEIVEALFDVATPDLKPDKAIDGPDFG